VNSASFAQFGKYFSAKNSGVFNWINTHHQTKVNKIPGVTLEADGFAGLPRFVQTNTQAHPVEYAKVTILIAKIMNFRYYLDSPSKVPAGKILFVFIQGSVKLTNVELVVLYLVRSFDGSPAFNLAGL